MSSSPAVHFEIENPGVALIATLQSQTKRENYFLVILPALTYVSHRM